MLVEFELIEKARSGDGEAFNRVVQAYRNDELRVLQLAGGCDRKRDLIEHTWL